MTEIILFYRPTCPFCLKALSLIYERYPIVELKLYNVTACPALIDVMHDYLPNAKTYPQIFIDGKFVGGYSDLFKTIVNTK